MSEERTKLNQVTGSSPVCGNCGKPLSAHHREDEDYCFHDTNGDIFTDEPQDWMVMDMIDDEIIEAARNKWKAENGHNSVTNK